MFEIKDEIYLKLFETNDKSTFDLIQIYDKDLLGCHSDSNSS